MFNFKPLNQSAGLPHNIQSDSFDLKGGHKEEESKHNESILNEESKEGPAG
jgi:hypothetical protein